MPSSPSSPTILGLDLSVTSTGVVAFNGAVQRAETVGSQAKTGSDPLRYAIILKPIRRIAKLYTPTLAVIEQYSFNAHGANSFKLIELGGVVKYQLWRMGIPHVTANRKTVAKHVTGFGNGSKDQMLLHVKEEWPAVKGHDQADAYALAKWGFDNYANFANLTA